LTRGSRTDTHDANTRRCIATGEVRDTGGMIRFVPGPDGDVVPDLAGKLPGRGLWVTADRDALALAVKKKLFSRAAKMQLKVDDGLVDLVEALMLRRVQDTLSLARKASQAITGYEKVRGWMDTERARVLIQACDGSERGKTKLRPPGGPETFIGHMTASELGMAFGRDRVIHAALGAGRLGKRVVEEAARLQGIRKDIGGNGSAGKELTDA
jgi:predicted RNA-binding protein YlxR (DUF448 family)